MFKFFVSKATILVVIEISNELFNVCLCVPLLYLTCTVVHPLDFTVVQATLLVKVMLVPKVFYCPAYSGFVEAFSL